jgi:alkylated DNA repair dioxygenase AlkB
VAAREAQRSLFGYDEPVELGFGGIERVELRDGAWVEIARGWFAGHAGLFDRLETATPWRAEERKMYDRVVDVPRLHAVLPLSLRDPAIETMRHALIAHYGIELDRVSVALYRDGTDSVAWHGDYVARNLPQALVATVSVGSPRKLLLRPTGGGASTAFTLGFGDLFVMGGTCQRTYQHAVPKVASAAPRIAIMFRPTWDEPSP